MKKKSGMTMVELIAVMAIMGIIGLVIMGFFISQNKMFSKVNDETIIQDEARLISTTIEEDLRVAKNVEIVELSTAGTATIRINEVDYTISGVNCKFVIGFIKKENDVDNTYVYYLDDKNNITKAKIESVGETYSLKVISTPSKNVTYFNVNKQVVPDGKTEYEINLSLDKNGIKADFKSNVVSRQA